MIHRNGGLYISITIGRHVAMYVLIIIRGHRAEYIDSTKAATEPTI
jgi:hypothetical protein